MSAYALDPEAQRDLESYLAHIVADDVMAALRQEYPPPLPEASRPRLT